MFLIVPSASKAQIAQIIIIILILLSLVVRQVNVLFLDSSPSRIFLAGLWRFNPGAQLVHEDVDYLDEVWVKLRLGQFSFVTEQNRWCIWIWTDGQKFNSKRKKNGNSLNFNTSSYVCVCVCCSKPRLHSQEMPHVNINIESARFSGEGRPSAAPLSQTFLRVLQVFRHSLRKWPESRETRTNFHLLPAQ